MFFFTQGFPRRQIVFHQRNIVFTNLMTDKIIEINKLTFNLHTIDICRMGAYQSTVGRDLFRGAGGHGCHEL